MLVFGLCVHVHVCPFLKVLLAVPCSVLYAEKKHLTTWRHGWMTLGSTPVPTWSSCWSEIRGKAGSKQSLLCLAHRYAVVSKKRSNYSLCVWNAVIVGHKHLWRKWCNYSRCIYHEMLLLKSVWLKEGKPTDWDVFLLATFCGNSGLSLFFLCAV